MNIFEIIGDIFGTIGNELAYGFRYGFSRTPRCSNIMNPYNRHAKRFNLCVDFNGENETAENYVGHKYIVINENENLVFIRDAVDYMHKKYGDNFKIRRISFLTQYDTGFWHDKVMHWKEKLNTTIYFSDNEEKNKAIIEKADSIFDEWIKKKPKFMEFNQQDWGDEYYWR